MIIEANVALQGGIEVILNYPHRVAVTVLASSLIVYLYITAYVFIRELGARSRNTK
jgi:hypothetical protein